MVKSDGTQRAPGSRMLQHARLLQAETQLQKKLVHPETLAIVSTEISNSALNIRPLSLPQLSRKPDSSLLSSFSASRNYSHQDEYATEQMPIETSTPSFAAMRITKLRNQARALLMGAREKSDVDEKAPLILSTGGSARLSRDEARQTTLSIPVVRAMRLNTSLVSSEGPAVVVKTAKGAAIAGIGDMLSAILRYTLNVVLTHMITQGTYGLFVETFMLVTVMGEIFKLGLDATVVRFLPVYLARRQQRLVLGLLFFVVGVVILAGLSGGALCFFGSSFLAIGVFRQPAYALPLQEFAPLVALIALQMVFASILQAFGAIKQKVCIDRLLQPLVSLILLLVFYLLGMKLQAIIFALLGGFLASAFSGGIFIKLAIKPGTGSVTPLFATGDWFAFMLPLVGNSLIRVVLNSLDVFFLGIFVTPAVVGLYGAADRLGWLVGMPLYALNIIFAPMITTYYAGGRVHALGELFKLVTGWVFSLSLPLLVCMLLFGQSLLALFGDEYRAAYLALILLALGNFVEAASGPVQYLLVMTGRPFLLLLNTLLAILINVGCEVWLVPQWQELGAAVATLVTVLVINLSSMLEIGYLLKKYPYRWNMWKSLLAGGIAALVGVGLRYLAIYVPAQLVFVQVLIEVLPLLLVYGICLRLLGFSREDRLIWRSVGVRLGFRQ